MSSSPNLFSKLRGSLLLEVMLACALLAIILPLIGSAIWRLQGRHHELSEQLTQQRFHSALKAQFDAHWSHLRPVGCTLSKDRTLTIGQGSQAPERLRRRHLQAQSDWLKAVDYGACRLSLASLNQSMTLTTPSSCDVSVGDSMHIATCSGQVKGQVMHLGHNQIRLALPPLGVYDHNGKQIGSLQGQAGVAQSHAGFYWYVRSGKSSALALWRTPQRSGNSLELWLGLQRMAVFPLLDTNHDGAVDAIDKRYGQYALKDTLGLWVEYLYKVPNCRPPTSTPITQIYQSMRGEQWAYVAPCQGIGNHIIIFK